MLAAMVDALASEYGWSAEYIMDLPADVNSQLLHALLARKGCKPRYANLELDETAETLSGRLESIWGKIDKSE